MLIKGEQFRNYLEKLFRQYGFNVELDQYVTDTRKYDLYMQKDEKKFIVEVIYSASGKIGQTILLDAAKEHLLIKNQDESIIVITNSLTMTPENINMKVFKSNIYFLNLFDLLYMVQKDDILKEELISILEISVENVVYTKDKINKEFFDSLGIVELPAKNSNIEKLKHELARWNVEKKFGDEYAKKYEKLCVDILKKIFNNELTSWKPQKKSNNNLYIFDLICRIKDNTNSEFWNMMEKYFHTKYVIFEFKNYKDAITQKEIYTTDKYLYEKALRKVAIIISCKGNDKNASTAARGTLRENGKLIIGITNDELLKMIEMKQNNEYPSDYLLRKMDELMMTLEK